MHRGARSAACTWCDPTTTAAHALCRWRVFRSQIYYIYSCFPSCLPLTVSFRASVSDSVTVTTAADTGVAQASPVHADLAGYLPGILVLFGSIVTMRCIGIVACCRLLRVCLHRIAVVGAPCTEALTRGMSDSSCNPKGSSPASCSISTVIIVIPKVCKCAIWPAWVQPHHPTHHTLLQGTRARGFAITDI